MFTKIRKTVRGRECIAVSGLGAYKIDDTLECGQAFRYERVCAQEQYTEYVVPIEKKLVSVGQHTPGELLFFSVDDDFFERKIVPFFSLDTDYAKINTQISRTTDSEWMKRAAESAVGVAILRQDAWETLFSFIVSQNNNIPRIRKILFSICRAYGENTAASLERCPLGKHAVRPCDKACADCGICYSFPTPDDILAAPEKMLSSKPGFRYKYLLAAAEAVKSGDVDLKKISATGDYGYTVNELKKIKGVGDKVASCVALFGFGNLEAFPIDVWVKKAINDYFGGHLNYNSFGKYAGIAQQYIFHYIRNLEKISPLSQSDSSD